MKFFAKIATPISLAVIGFAFIIADSSAISADSPADSPKGEIAPIRFIERPDADVKDIRLADIGLTEEDIRAPVDVRFRMFRSIDFGRRPYGCAAYIDRLPGRAVSNSGVLDFLVEWEPEGSSHVDSVIRNGSGLYERETHFRIEATPDKSETWVRFLGWGNYSYGRIRAGRDISAAFSPSGQAVGFADCERRVQGVLLAMSMEPWAGSCAYEPMTSAWHERSVRRQAEAVARRAR